MRQVQLTAWTPLLGEEPAGNALSGIGRDLITHPPRYTTTIALSTPIRVSAVPA